MAEKANLVSSRSISVDDDTWDKLKEHAKLPRNSRSAAAQAGVIIREYFDKLKSKKVEE